MRSIEELTDTDEPAWPLVAQWIARAPFEVVVLPVDPPQSGTQTLYRLQVTARSPLGALALNTGGLVVDHGWLRILGAGAPGLPDLAIANHLAPAPGTPPTQRPPGHLVIGYDVLGGTFAVNHTDLPVEPGEVCYFGPDTLDWTPLGISGHGSWLQWVLGGGLGEVFADLRWDGWQNDTTTLEPGRGLLVYPPLFTVEGRHGPVSRRPVPLVELIEQHTDIATQLASAGDPEQIRLTTEVDQSHPSGQGPAADTRRVWRLCDIHDTDAFLGLPSPVLWQRDEHGPEWMPETLLELPSGARVVLRWEVPDIGLWTPDRPIVGDFTAVLLGDRSWGSRRWEVLAELVQHHQVDPLQVVADPMLEADRPFDLTSPVEPWVVVTPERDRVAQLLIRTAESGGVVRHLDGRRMTDPAGLFEEFALKLEFPDYFGRNWDAMVDCLDDLHGRWHGRRPVTVVIDQIDAIAGRDFFPLLVAVLCQAAERANLSLNADDQPRDRPPVPLHFVLLLAADGFPLVTQALSTRHDLLLQETDGRLLISVRPEPEHDR